MQKENLQPDSCFSDMTQEINFCCYPLKFMCFQRSWIFEFRAATGTTVVDMIKHLAKRHLVSSVTQILTYFIIKSNLLEKSSDLKETDLTVQFKSDDYFLLHKNLEANFSLTRILQTTFQICYPRV